MKAREVLPRLFAEVSENREKLEVDPRLYQSGVAGNLIGNTDIELELYQLEGEYEDWMLVISYKGADVYWLYAGDLEGDGEPIPHTSMEHKLPEGSDLIHPHTPEALGIIRLIDRFFTLAQGTVPATQ